MCVDVHTAVVQTGVWSAQRGKSRAGCTAGLRTHLAGCTAPAPPGSRPVGRPAAPARHVPEARQAAAWGRYYVQQYYVTLKRSKHGRTVPVSWCNGVMV